ncbi:MAG: hypothetical protein WC307_07240, partial [Candidatus Nanoarchaeia archaeon]
NIALSESTNKTAYSIKTDNVVLTDSRTLNTYSFKSESLSLTESRTLTTNSIKNETLALSETKNVDVTTTKYENLAMNEAYTFTPNYLMTEEINLSDTGTNWVVQGPPELLFAKVDYFNLRSLPGEK